MGERRLSFMEFFLGIAWLPISENFGFPPVGRSLQLQSNIFRSLQLRSNIANAWFFAAKNTFEILVNDDCLS
jgi:hypothetical protein